eukprot:gene10082-21013_t
MRMKTIVNSAQSKLDRLRKQIEKTPAAQYAIMIEDKTGINYEYFAVGSVLLAGIFLFFGVAAGFICHIVGFAYPFYATLRSLETQGSHDTTQWLIYWVVYGLFGCLEAFIDLFLFWVPFYYPLKLSFLLWCMLPQFRGATYLYETFIQDIFKAHEDKIDAALSKVDASGVFDAAAAVASSVSAAVNDAH